MSKTPTPAEIARAKAALREGAKHMGSMFIIGQGIHLAGAIALRRLTRRLNTAYGLDIPEPTLKQAFLIIAAARNLNSTIFHRHTDRTLDRLEPETLKVYRERQRADERAKAERMFGDSPSVRFSTAGMPPDLAEQIDSLARDIVAGLRDRGGRKKTEAFPDGRPPGWAATRPAADRNRDGSPIADGGPRRPTPPPVTEDSATESPTPDPLETGTAHPTR